MSDGRIPGISVVLLTFNSEAAIERTLQSIAGLTDDIHVVDSYSSDRTLEICAKYGCQISQRPFKHYSDQRNWAIDNLALKHDWQFHIDSDEEVSPELRDEILRLKLDETPFDGFIMGRKIVFLGKVLRFGGIARTWHYRLFRRGFGRCEDRLYDQHFVGTGRIGLIKEFLLDHQDNTISEWTARHNRWSDMEVAEVLSSESSEKSVGVVKGDLSGTRIERTRYLKGRYYRLPLFLRVFLYTAYRYIFLLGFLDGRRGLIYHLLQGFWFRFLIDSKIYEARLASAPLPKS